MFLVVSDADDLESRRVFVERSEGKMSLCILEGKGKSDERVRVAQRQGGSLFSARTQWDLGGVQRWRGCEDQARFAGAHLSP